MPVLFRDTVTRQPQYPAAIDWGHPLAPKRGFVVSQHGGTTMLHWRGGRYALNIGQQIYDQGYRGLGAPGVSTAVGGVTLPAFGGAGTDGCTVLFIASKHSSATVAHRVFDVDVGGGASCIAAWDAGASQWFFANAVPSVGSNQFAITAGSSLTSGDVVAFINDGTGTSASTTGYIRGQSVSVTQTVGPQVGTVAGLSGLSNFYIGNRPDGTRGWDGPIGFIYFDQSQRAAAEVRELSRNPWQIYQPPARKLWLMGAAGGGTDYPVTRTESADASDTASLTIIYAATAAEIAEATSAHAAAMAAAVSIAETGEATSTQAAVLTAFVSIAETGAATDSASSAGLYGVTVAEAADAADVESAIRALFATASETGAAADTSSASLPGTYSVTVVEAANAEDAAAQAMSALVVIAEALAAADVANWVGAVIYTRAPRGGGYPATVPTTERYGMTNTKRPAMTNTRR